MADWREAAAGAPTWSHRILAVHGLIMLFALPLALLLVSIAVASPLGTGAAGEWLLGQGVGTTAPALLMPQVAFAACVLGCVELGLYAFVHLNPFIGLRAATLYWATSAVALVAVWFQFSWRDLLVLATIQTLCGIVTASGTARLSKSRQFSKYSPAAS